MLFEFEKGLAEKLKNELESRVDNLKEEDEIKEIYLKFQTVFRDYFSSLEILNDEFNIINDGSNQDFSKVEQEFFNIEYIKNELENKLSDIQYDLSEIENIDNFKNSLYEKIYNIENYESTLETKLEEFEALVNEAYKDYVSYLEEKEHLKNIRIEKLRELIKEVNIYTPDEAILLLKELENPINDLFNISELDLDNENEIIEYLEFNCNGTIEDEELARFTDKIEEEAIEQLEQLERIRKTIQTFSYEEIAELIETILKERIVFNGFKEEEIYIDNKIINKIIEKKCNDNIKYYDFIAGQKGDFEAFIYTKEDLLELMKYLKYEELKSIDEELEKYTKEAYKLRKDLRLKREEIEDRLRKTKDDEERNILRKFLNQFENDLSPEEMAILKKQLNGIDFMADKIKDQLASYFK